MWTFLQNEEFIILNDSIFDEWAMHKFQKLISEQDET